MNLQNPSKNVCKIHIPDDGKVFIQVDQAGAEALIVAYLTPHRKFRDLFLAGIKPHVFVAMHIFKEQWESEGFPARFFCSLPIDKITEQTQWKTFERAIKDSDTRYFLGKKTVHAGNYREGAKTSQSSILTETGGELFVPIKDCELFLILYRETLFPEIPHAWWPEVEYQLKKYRVLYNLFGFPITFTSKINDKVIREATSAVPQSTVGTITNIAFCELQEVVERDSNYKDVDLLNNKHDSILCQCDIGHEIEVAKLMKHYIEKELTSPRGEKFRMRSEAAVGYNWGKYNEKTNPRGLKELYIPD